MTSKRNLSNDILYTTNPAWTDTCANLGLRGENPATNRLNHDTVKPTVTVIMKIETF
jgi:hypothetical protein